LSNAMSITPQPSLKTREGRLKHGSILNGNIGLCRVSSQWQSTSIAYAALGDTMAVRLFG
ncbi:hypothetical protein, partial [Shinella sp. WSJ-2]|uniref:hypothetical protein n=1 Tax=Shinella sp. WSJ-2 TaxID=2303749 RepID=UPI001AECDD58